MEVNLKPNAAKTGRPPDLEDSSAHSKDKRTTASNRRRQRHSTEIGSEYYRWWAVRSALGFQTNEHIAGLLLDGFHALLQHIVCSCGGDEYPGGHGSGHKNGKDKTDPTTKAEHSSSSSSSSSSSTTNSSLSSFCSTSSSFSSSSSTSSSSCCDPYGNNAFISNMSSPPGAEDMEGFSEFNQAIAHYTNALRWMCAQPDNGLQKLKHASPVLQDFLGRLNRYLLLGGGRSLSCLNDRKKPFSKDSPFLVSPNSATSHVNAFSISAMTLAPLSSIPDMAKPALITTTTTPSDHDPNYAPSGYPPYITPSLTSLMLSSKGSNILPPPLPPPPPPPRKKPFSKDSPFLVSPNSATSHVNAFSISAMTLAPLSSIPDMAKPALITTTTTPSDHDPNYAPSGYPPYITPSLTSLMLSSKGSNILPPPPPPPPPPPRKKPFSKDSPFLVSPNSATSHVNAFSISAMTLAPLSSIPDMAKPALITTTTTPSDHDPNYAPSGYPPYITPSLTSLMLSSKGSNIPDHHKWSMTKVYNPPSSSNLPWTSSIPLHNTIVTKDNNGTNATAQKPFICNQNNTMRDNFNLFRMYQDISKPDSAPLQPQDKQIEEEHSSMSFRDDCCKKTTSTRSDSSIKSNAVYPNFLEDEEQYPDNQPVPKDQNISKVHHYQSGLVNTPLHPSKSFAKSEFNKDTTYSFNSHHHQHQFHDRGDAYTRYERLSDYKGSESVEKRENKTCAVTDSELYNPYQTKRSAFRSDQGFSSPVAVNSLSSFPKPDAGDQIDAELKRSPSSTAMPTIDRYQIKSNNGIGDATKHNNSGHQISCSYSKTATTTTTTTTTNNNNNHNSNSSSDSNNNGRSSGAASKPKRYVCKLCDEVLFSGIDLVVHRYEQHSHVCGECDGRFLSLARLKQHKASDHPQMLQMHHGSLPLTIIGKASHRPALERSRGTADHEEEFNDSRRTVSSTDSNSDSLTASAQSGASAKQGHYNHGKDQDHLISKRSHPCNDNMQRHSYLNTQIQQDPNNAIEGGLGGRQNHDYNIMRTPSDNSNSVYTTAIQHQTPTAPSRETPCTGRTTLPAFNNESTSYNNNNNIAPSSKIDTIVNRLIQVKDHRRHGFDQHPSQNKARPSVVPTSPREESNESFESKDLVIDTGSGFNSDGASKDLQPSQSTRRPFSHIREDPEIESVEMYLQEDGYNGNEGKMNPKLEIVEEDTAGASDSLSLSNTDSSLFQSVDCRSKCYNVQTLETDNNSNTIKFHFSDRFRKKRRKGHTVKYSSKKFRREEEYSLSVEEDRTDYNVNSTTNVFTSQPQNRSSDFEINEKSAQNNVIKPHTVWLDNCHNLDATENQSGHEIYDKTETETWNTRQPATVHESTRETSRFKFHSPAPKRHIEHSLQLGKESGDASTPGNKSDVESRREDEILDRRSLSLRERHRSYSLPPKKRSIRK